MRRDAYAKLLQAISEFTERGREVQVLLKQGMAPAPQALGEFRALLKELEEAVAAVELEGPKKVATAAFNVMAHLAMWHACLVTDIVYRVDLSIPRQGRSVEEAEAAAIEAVVEFKTLARGALDDPSGALDITQ
ncbi:MULTISPECIES: hypothetical protein [unclassified Streptomyces]|uniref:hypothetical protein n=1 Tax=unclassified Streptomyces TaxID=2593676 RepID=UPI0003A556D3|nr:MULTISPECIES: hypothetical protein [unclassified Streptomyces]MYT31786.1 hypothetical protein [Streptomyces sp. SID8354]